MSNNKMYGDLYVGPVNAWKSLGIGIVKQAIIDWHVSKLKIARPETATKEYNEMFRSAEKFLRSTWVEFYSGLDGPTILRKLKEGIL